MSSKSFEDILSDVGAEIPSETSMSNVDDLNRDLTSLYGGLMQIISGVASIPPELAAGAMGSEQSIQFRESCQNLGIGSSSSSNVVNVIIEGEDDDEDVDVDVEEENADDCVLDVHFDPFRHWAPGARNCDQKHRQVEIIAADNGQSRVRTPSFFHPSSELQKYLFAPTDEESDESKNLTFKLTRYLSTKTFSKFACYCDGSNFDHSSGLATHQLSNVRIHPIGVAFKCALCPKAPNEQVVEWRRNKQARIHMVQHHHSLYFYLNMIVAKTQHSFARAVEIWIEFIKQDK